MRWHVLIYYSDSPPDHIEALYDDLTESREASAVLGRLNSNESGWLARYIRDQINKDREMGGDIFEKLTVGQFIRTLMDSNLFNV
jgi:hypothetical protein